MTRNRTRGVKDVTRIYYTVQVKFDPVSANMRRGCNNPHVEFYVHPPIQACMLVFLEIVLSDIS